MENVNLWDKATKTSGGLFVKLETGVRKTLVGMNPAFNEVEKTFQGETKQLLELSLDIVEEDNEECEKKLTTVSKRLITALRPLFEGVPEDKEVRFTIKRIGDGTDVNYDAELVE